jgi:thymidylate kinase
VSQPSRQQQAIFISFSGIDGAGKSTQIQNLVDHLTDAGLTVAITTFWDDVVALRDLREGVGHKVFKGDKGVGSPDAPIVRKDKNVQTPMITLSRLGLYLLDALSLRRVARKARTSGAHVVIFDRYLFDELANLNLRNPFIRLYIRLILKLVPRPEISFILDADPDKAFARKPEYPLEFLHSNRRAYLALAQLLGGIHIIPPATIEEAKANVVGIVRTRQIPALAAPSN